MGANIGSGGTGMPPGMMMPPPYIPLGQGGAVPAFYSVPSPMYAGYDETSMQFMQRLPPHMSYYDGSANYGECKPAISTTNGKPWY